MQSENDGDGGTSATTGSTPITTPNAAAELANKVIEYLSAAPPEQLIAISIGGAVVLYAVLGKLGLLFVGVVVGAVGHASLNLAHAKKDGSVFSVEFHDWLEARKRAAGEEAGDDAVLVKVHFSSLPPETAKAMEELVDAIVRDYVRSWYSPLLPAENNFPGSCRNVVTNALLAMYHRIASKRGADTFLLFLMSASNTFIVFLRELAATQQTTVENYMEESPSSALAQLLDRDLQKRKLRMAADDVLRSFFGKDVLDFEPVRTFLTEIFAGVVLEMTVDKCSHPDWINDWLVYLLDVDTQPEVLQKIDIGEATAAASQGPTPTKQPTRAEEEMSRALEEAKEMNRMIVEEEHERKRLSSTDVSVTSNANGTERSSFSMDNGYERKNPQQAPPPPTPPSAEEHQFTSFNQLVQTPREQTLHRAHISLSDLTPPAVNNPYSVTPDTKAMRSKPTSAEYLLQIEPASPSMPGWVVVRKYTDIENLHEVLKRIAAISGAETFRRHHAEPPNWRGETLASLRLHLEGYLNDALHERGLAECEGMKRFLEKDPGTTPGKTGFGIGKGWPNPAAFAKMGQGALDVLSKAPQGVAEGGKGLFGGMKKAFAVAQQRGEGDPTPPPRPRRQTTDPFGELAMEHHSQVTRNNRPQSMMERPSRNVYTEPSARASSIYPTADSKSRRPESLRESPTFLQLEVPDSENGDALSVISLPPPPSDMPDDYDANYRSSASISPILEAEPEREPEPQPEAELPSAAEPEPPKPPPRHKSAEPLTTQETQFIVDIVFALLTELYTLSSAWTLRRSLLNVAKSILLRPGNASLQNIRVVIQESVIDANTSDPAVAALIRKVRENVFPTLEEMEKWADEERLKGEELRAKARKLLLRKGVPEALRGVMGAVASEEALGAVFDALQMPPVARGVVGGVVLEGVRGVCQ
ncbi:PXA domain-containing protein [Sphaerosporella brunnea]|uniref:PXA domain-containing protein n=1 Tax=Sphaerosporella brunnea TaxID=1250544 RepID=A0A5J5FB17_9PEZI|nr:PXA domain-containing protein [Sphaerosporella brunnea]